MRGKGVWAAWLQAPRANRPPRGAALAVTAVSRVPACLVSAAARRPVLFAHAHSTGARGFAALKKQGVLAEYESALRTTLKSDSGQYQEKQGTQKKEDADILPRVKLERFLRRHRLPAASFNYVEEREGPNLPPTAFICNIRAAGRGCEGRGDSRFDATQQACHLWLQEYSALHVQEMRKSQKLNPKVREPPPIFAPADAPWYSLPVKIEKQKAVKAPWLAPVPELAHGLSRVLHRDNSKATPIWEKLGGKPASAYVRTIVQPKDINWEAVAPFTPPSFDDTLHELAVKHKSKYKASTSSITGLLSHVYQVISNYRPADTSGLSAAFKGQPNTFSYTVLKKPVGVLLRKKDGVYGIDSHQDSARDNQILIDLGKTMERMLTMSEQEFKSLMMKPLDIASREDAENATDASFEAVETVDMKGGIGVTHAGKGSRLADAELRGTDRSEEQALNAADEGATAQTNSESFLLGAYNYSKAHGFMLRSQLDCIYGGNQIFDIKTRATHAIRNCFNLLPDVPAHERHLQFLDYKITQQAGLWNSFERELYDMIRAAFLKYSGQCRIGRMDGAFVTYHNTQEIFGFQYVEFLHESSVFLCLESSARKADSLRFPGASENDG